MKTKIKTKPTPIDDPDLISLRNAISAIEDSSLSPTINLFLPVARSLVAEVEESRDSRRAKRIDLQRINLRLMRTMIDNLVSARRLNQSGCSLNHNDVRQRQQREQDCVDAIIEWWLSGGKEDISSLVVD